MQDLALIGIGRVQPASFDVTSALPGRGYRRLPEAVQYLLAAANAAVADAGGLGKAVVGSVIGTNNAVSRTVHEINQVLTEKGGAALSPALAPFFAISLPAGRVAVELGIRGFSVTLTSPRTAGLDGLRLGARALTVGRAELVLVGATEGALADGEPGYDHADAGAAVLICETTERAAARGASARAVFRVTNAFVAPGAPAAPALDPAWAALTESAPWPPVTAILDDSPVGAAVAAWLRARMPDVSFDDATAGCLAPLERVADTLGPGSGRGSVVSEVIVVTAAAEGNVALARVRPGPDQNGS